MSQTGKKTLSFAFVHMVVAFTVVYLLTGSAIVGGLVALIEPMCNTGAYYLHERLWASRDRLASGKSQRGERPGHGRPGPGHLASA